MKDHHQNSNVHLQSLNRKNTRVPQGLLLKHCRLNIHMHNIDLAEELILSRRKGNCSTYLYIILVKVYQ